MCQRTCHLSGPVKYEEPHAPPIWMIPETPVMNLSLGGNCVQTRRQRCYRGCLRELRAHYAHKQKMSIATEWSPQWYEHSRKAHLLWNPDTKRIFTYNHQPLNVFFLRLWEIDCGLWRFVWGDNSALSPLYIILGKQNSGGHDLFFCWFNILLRLHFKGLPQVQIIMADSMVCLKFRNVTFQSIYEKV